MKHLFIYLFLLACLLMVGPLDSRAQAGTPDLQLLEKEYSLAADKSMYVVLEQGRGQISLKIKGIVLREWKTKEVRTWGALPTDEILSLVQKTALTLPEREKIQPGDTTIVAKDAFDIQALELVDMPTSFTLILEKDIEIYVAPQLYGFKSFPKSMGREFRWRVLLPLRTVLHTVQKKPPFSALRCVLETKEDVQALFWALNEGTKFLIVPSVSP